jgi:hypothetical protein
MEKTNGFANRDLRERDQQSENNWNRNQQAYGGRDRYPDDYDDERPSGLSPNYDSNYRPGEYDRYADRNRRNRESNRFNEGKNRGGNRQSSEERVRNENPGYTYPQGINQFESRSENDRNWRDDEQYGAFRSTGDDPYRGYRNEGGQHRGKGPKGYTRSDERIKDDINEKLTDDGHVDAREIEVEVRSGEVVLTGFVRSRPEKRRTEDIIERISGVKNIENRLKVQGQGFNAAEEQYTNGLRERRGGLEYGPGAVSGMGNTSATGDFNTAG